MAYCTNCGQELRDGAKFCDNCGATVSPNESKTERTIHYDGSVHKCPNCGETLDSFTSLCPTCGYEIRDAQSNSAVKELAQKLEAIQNRKMPPFQARRSVLKTLVGKDFHNTDEEAEAKEEFEKGKKEEKIELILNFPVPNTREDILEFMLLAYSNIDITQKDDEITKTWLSKFEQVYKRAELTMGNTPEFDQIRHIYESKQEEFHREEHKVDAVRHRKLVTTIILGSLSLFMILIGFFAGSASNNPNSPFYVLALLGFFPGIAISFIWGKK